MDTSINELKATVENYIGAVERMIAEHKAEVAGIVEAAIAADDAAEAVDIRDIKEKLDISLAKLTAPGFDPSANG